MAELLNRAEYIYIFVDLERQVSAIGLYRVSDRIFASILVLQQNSLQRNHDIHLLLVNANIVQYVPRSKVMISNLHVISLFTHIN